MFVIGFFKAESDMVHLKVRVVSLSGESIRVVHCPARRPWSSASSDTDNDKATEENNNTNMDFRQVIATEGDELDIHSGEPPYGVL